VLLPSLQVVLATDWRIAAWNAVQQTNRREADVRVRVLTTGIDDVESQSAVRHPESPSDGIAAGRTSFR
jgi:hypothetical protein